MVAVTGMCGFEGQAALADWVLIAASGGGSATYDTGVKNSGAASLYCVSGSSNSSSGISMNSSVNCSYLHFAYRCKVRPTVSPGKSIAGTSDTTNKLNLRQESDGTLSIYNYNTLVGNGTTALDLNTWYWIGFRQVAGTSVVFLKINGVDEITATVATIAEIGREVGPVDAFKYAAMECYIDDVIATSDGFIDSPSCVAMLVPTSDNARATLWTGGSGGTTNLYDVVDNIPPVGSASENNTTQIEHAGGAAGTTDAYDANMTTYTTAGITASDAILGIQYQITTGEDSGTGDKLLNFSLVSNPTQATGLANFNVYSAGSSNALGTFPSNWKTTANTMVTNPSVTLGTAPVMRVVRPETASRVASVCYMSMFVAYSPPYSPPSGGSAGMPYLGGGYYPS